MAAEICIQYTNKTEEPGGGISHIGGILDGQQWKITEEDAIRGIENRTYSFHILLRGKVVDVFVASAENGRKHLRTRADTGSVRHLLNLPDCPEP